MKIQKILKLKMKFVAAIILSFGAGEILANRLPALVGSERCRPVEIAPEECAASRQESLDAGCINKGEFDWATANSMSVLCINRKPKVVCACGCFDRDVKISTDSSLGAAETLAGNIQAEDKPLSMEAGTDLVAPSFEGKDIVYTTRGEEKRALPQS